MLFQLLGKSRFPLQNVFNNIGIVAVLSSLRTPVWCDDELNSPRRRWWDFWFNRENWKHEILFYFEDAKNIEKRMTREGDGDQMLLQNAKVANFSYFSQFNKSLFCHNKIITTTCYAKLPLFVYFWSFLITISKIQI